MLVDGRQGAAGFTTVAAAGGGWVWAGAASRGMLLLHVAGERIDAAHWVTDRMLARAAIKFARIDRRGWVWVGTDAGILVFDGRIWRRLKTNDGLISDDTMPDGFLADTDGSVWIGTRAGLTHIETPETLSQTAQIDLRITRLTLGTNRLEARSPPLPWEPNLFLKVHIAQLNGAASQSSPACSRCYSRRHGGSSSAGSIGSRPLNAPVRMLLWEKIRQD
jgi:hypothetical protein